MQQYSGGIDHRPLSLTTAFAQQLGCALQHLGARRPASAPRAGDRRYLRAHSGGAGLPIMQRAPGHATSAPAQPLPAVIGEFVREPVACDVQLDQPHRRLLADRAVGGSITMLMNII